MVVGGGGLYESGFFVFVVPQAASVIAIRIASAEVPGVARRQLTFFASPKKVSKERRPQVRRRFAVPIAIQGRPAGSQNSDSARPVQEVGFVARPQTCEPDGPGRLCIARRLSWGP